MLNSSLDIKTIYWILAGVSGAILAIVGNELSTNIIRFFSKKGRPPKKRSIYLWLIFFLTLITSIFFGALGIYESYRSATPSVQEYIGFVVNSENEPVQGAIVTIYINDTTLVSVTDADGMYRFEIPTGTTLSGNIVVDFEDHESFYADAIFDPSLGTIAEIRIISQPDTKATATSKSPTPRPTEIREWATISCDVEQVSLRRSPGYIDKDDSIDVLVKIDCGQRVQLLGKKQEKDKLTWWNVSWNGYKGWMADHTGSGRVILIFNP